MKVTDNDLASLRDALKPFQMSLSDEQRKEFWSLLKEGFCEQCGRVVYVEEGDRCNCWNDE